MRLSLLTMDELCKELYSEEPEPDPLKTKQIDPEPDPGNDG